MTSREPTARATAFVRRVKAAVGRARPFSNRSGSVQVRLPGPLPQGAAIGGGVRSGVRAVVPIPVVWVVRVFLLLNE